MTDVADPEAPPLADDVLQKPAPSQRNSHGVRCETIAANCSGSASAYVPEAERLN